MLSKKQGRVGAPAITECEAMMFGEGRTMNIQGSIRWDLSGTIPFRSSEFSSKHFVLQTAIPAQGSFKQVLGLYCAGADFRQV